MDGKVLSIWCVRGISGAEARTRPVMLGTPSSHGVVRDAGDAAVHNAEAFGWEHGRWPAAVRTRATQPASRAAYMRLQATLSDISNRRRDLPGLLGFAGFTNEKNKKT